LSQTLTTRTVETIKPGPTRREVPDAHLPGIYLIVQPSGAKSWAARYRHFGESRKLTIGSYPAIDLKSARDLARKALRAVAEGRDPGRERTTRPDTVEAVARQFVELHCERSNRPRTAQETTRLLDLHMLLAVAGPAGAGHHPPRRARPARPYG
jgi:Arm DNA-binding domain